MPGSKDPVPVTRTAVLRGGPASGQRAVETAAAVLTVPLSGLDALAAVYHRVGFQHGVAFYTFRALILRERSA